MLFDIALLCEWDWHALSKGEHLTLEAAAFCTHSRSSHSVLGDNENSSHGRGSIQHDMKEWTKNLWGNMTSSPLKEAALKFFLQTQDNGKEVRANLVTGACNCTQSS